MKRRPVKRNIKSKRSVRPSITITIPLPRPDELLTYALLIIGATGLIYSLGPLALGARAETAATHATAVQQQPVPKPVGLERSIPTQLTIPDIAVDTSLILLGKNPDGTLAAPDRYDIAGWYELSPTPGEVGPAVIVGHVDNYLGPAVFFRLSELQPGQLIHVKRQDGKTVQFRVDKSELFDQQNFPTSSVYGNIDYPGLRLITCGGIFNPFTGRYSHNTVVYASYVSS